VKEIEFTTLGSRHFAEQTTIDKSINQAVGGGDGNRANACDFASGDNRSGEKFPEEG
jgi:hypothetical protein